MITKRKNFNNQPKSVKWAKFFENWKKVWRNPKIHWSVKLVLFNVLLYRSDEKGWYISERKMAADFGMGKETVSKAIDYAISHKLLLTGENNFERKRRKLRLSGSLRSPGWASLKPNNWVSTKPSKYQGKYQSNNSSFKEEKTREGKMTKALTSEETKKRTQELKEKSKRP